jgi:peroxidase
LHTLEKEFQLEDLLTARQLQFIADLSGCHQHKRRVNCSQRCLKYRTLDGVCNNLEHPHWGSANTQLRRLVKSEYENGFNTPRGWTPTRLHNGFRLPSARVVSSRIISTDKITNDNTFTHMLMQWGQFLDHDLSHTVMAASLNRFSNGIACKDSCINEQPCFAIEIPQNDSFRAYYPDKCMEFVRSSAICGTGETGFLYDKILQREQINQLTSYIDASNVYGSNDQDGFDLRERVLNNGQLKVYNVINYPKGLLPFNLDTPMDCQRDNTTQIGCFLAGDYRANEQLALLAMHNVWVRQHNRLAEKLQALNPEWSPEQLYQETRKIVSAQMQHITYAHWLPYILGKKGMQMLGTYQGYDPNVDASIANEFATAAFRYPTLCYRQSPSHTSFHSVCFRFGHALIQPFTFRLNETLQPTHEGHLLLRDSFFAPHLYLYEGGPDPLIRGLFGTPAKLKMPREIMNSELTEKLFHITRTISQDLAALNIQVI